MKKDKKRKKRRTHYTVRKRKIVTRASTQALKPPQSLVKISKRPKGRYVNLRECVNMNAEEYIRFRNFGKELVEKHCVVNLGFNQQNETAKKNCLDEIFNHYPMLVREKDQWVAEDLLRTALINKRQYIYKKEQKKRASQETTNQRRKSLSDVEMKMDASDMSADDKTDDYGSPKNNVSTTPVTTFPKKPARSFLNQIFDRSENETKAWETDKEIESQSLSSHDNENESKMMCSEDDQESRKKRVRPISLTNLGQKFVKKRSDQY